MWRRDEGQLRELAESGDVRAMGELGSALMWNWTAARWESDPERLAEGVRWWERAAAAGNVRAMSSLAAHHRNLQNNEEWERWRLAAAEGGDRASMRELRWLLEHRGRPEEAIAWNRRLAELGETSAIREEAQRSALAGDTEGAWDWLLHDDDENLPDNLCRIGEALADAGDEETAEAWMREALDAGSMGAALWYAERAQDVQTKEAYLRRSGSTFTLGRFLEEQERLEDAAEVYRAAGYLMMLAEVLDQQGLSAEAEEIYRADGDSIAYAEFLDRHGRTGEAARVRSRMAPVAAARVEAAEWATVITTVVVTTGVLPFVQGMITKAAEDTYDGVRGLLRKVAGKRRGREAELAPSTLLVIRDPDSRLRLHMRTDATDEALAALAALDLDTLPAKGKSLRWDEETRQWRAH